MAKDFELIYSPQKTGFEPGRAYANPRFFTTPRESVTKVYVVGSWPDVVAAYRRRGVPVVVMADTAELIGLMKGEEPQAQPARPASNSQRQEMENAGIVARESTIREQEELPANWRDLPWVPREPGALCLRSIAALFSDQPVLNKAMAVAVLTAEENRRKAA